jgi:hypothetical protein
MTQVALNESEMREAYFNELSYLDSWLAEFSNTDSMRFGAEYEILATSLGLACRSPILQTILLTCLAWFMPLHALDAMTGQWHSAEAVALGRAAGHVRTGTGDSGYSGRVRV